MRWGCGRQADLDVAVAHLAGRRALVALDNCEHLLDETATVAEALLRGCPEVTVLATSRAPLGVPGESDWRVPSLSLPQQSTEGVEQSDAARLFGGADGDVDTTPNTLFAVQGVFVP